MSVEIVDTHVHVGTHWYEPVEVLLRQMDANGVAKAVLVQYMGNYDNQYELECARRFPGRFAPVVLVDTARPDAPATLERWAKMGAVGIRLSPEQRSPGRDPLAIWRQSAQLGLVVSCAGNVQQFASEEFHRLVRELPDLKIVIEHLAGVGRDAQPPYTQYRKALELAQYPNTYIKVPGLGEICPRPMPFKVPPFPQAPETLKMAYDAFGPRRMMWGSDYPPVSSREGYGNALRFPMEQMHFLSQDDKEWVFGKSALSVWRFL